MIDPLAYIAHGAVVLGDVHLGRDVSVWYNAVVRGDAERITIGDEANIQDLSMVHADPGVPCVVGRRVTVGHRAILHGCTVGDGCLIGMGAILLNGVRLGEGSVVGAGAVLTAGTEVPLGSLVLGVPGKVIRHPLGLAHPMHQSHRISADWTVASPPKSFALPWTSSGRPSR